MSTTVKLDESNFDQTVTSSDKPVLVDFWAEWCGPCRMIAPVLEQLAQEMSDSLVVAKVNTDENGSLAMKYGIQSIPCLVLLRNGEEVHRIIGAQPKDRLVAQLKPHLGANAG